MITQSLCVGRMALSSTDATLGAAFAAYSPANVRGADSRGFGCVGVEDGRLEVEIKVRVADPQGSRSLARREEGGSREARA